MYKDPKNPSRKIIEAYNPPIRIKRIDRDAKAIAYYKFQGSSNNLYYYIDVYEETGIPFGYKGGSWSAENCVLMEVPKSNKDAVNLLEEAW